MVGHTAHKGSYVAYIVCALIPAALRFIVGGSQSHVLLGIAMIVGVAMLLRIAEQSNKFSVQALLIGIKYREQAAMLAEANSRTETLNQQLMAQATALQQSEARFRGLSGSTFEGIAIHDQGCIVDANQAALDMLGYTQSEIIGLHINDLIAPEFQEIAAQHGREGYEQPYEIGILHKDGSVLPVEVQAKTVPYEDRQVRVVAVRDISFHKQLEQQALELKMEHARVELLKTFFQNASHEFNTPLSIIRTSAYLIERANTSEKRERSLENIDQQVERISKLVEDLSFLIKLDTDIEMRRGPTDLNIVIQSAAEPLNESFKRKRQQIVIQTDDRVPYVQADADLLRQSFDALLQNAGRYTPEDGTITIRTNCDDEHVYVAFQDDGMGITEDALPHIFDRFYRADEAHTTSGFGIGLPIARSIIELHQGRISVESQPGKGSTFTVQLPLTSAL
jgi:PAS domain S-box-containing protein